MHSLLPGVVPMTLLPRAIAASASAQQTAVICGPSIGGLLYVLGPAVVYATCTVIFIAASVLISLVHIERRREERRPISLETLFAGFVYVRSHPILLGAISLDLFAVLLGGVTALLPIYARDILQAGPWALGLLRSAPAVGALAATVILAHHAIAGRAGWIMFVSVGMFGLASVLFGLSSSIPLSCLALAIYGAADSVSVVIRQSLVQMRTPRDVLGRVMAVNSMFSGSSGSLGEFRAGAVAAWLGAVPSVLIGGVGAIAVMLIWMWAFPQLRQVDKLASEATS
jgi:MFS family permease